MFSTISLLRIIIISSSALHRALDLQLWKHLETLRMKMRDGLNHRRGQRFHQKHDCVGHALQHSDTYGKLLGKDKGFSGYIQICTSLGAKD